MTSPLKQITVISGDGIGQKSRCTLQILEAASTPLQWVKCSAGEACFKDGISTGVPDETLAAIKETTLY